ncbi:MAG: DUF2950 family protein [Planctomycetes bacterium]|nr:DUF2950 family protein [Planctomycetota bacterium]
MHEPSKSGTANGKSVQYSFRDLWLLTLFTYFGLRLCVPGMVADAKFSDEDMIRSEFWMIVVSCLLVILTTSIFFFGCLWLCANFKHCKNTSQWAVWILLPLVWWGTCNVSPRLLNECFHWPEKPAYDLSLVDKAFAAAAGSPGTAQPKCGGYVFSVLTGQPAKYRNNNTPSFSMGLTAPPTGYGNTGLSSFRINDTGAVYQEATPTKHDDNISWVVSE